MVAELLLRPDLGKRAYRLKARFVIGAFPGERTLEKAKYHAAELFVRDMAKQGWQYVEHYGFTLRGPFAAVETMELPKASQQEAWHVASKDMLPGILAGRRFRSEGAGYTRIVPLLGETDAWEYELSGVFTHDTILTEVPDAHEEQEVLR